MYLLCSKVHFDFSLAAKLQVIKKKNVNALKKGICLGLRKCNKIETKSKECCKCLIWTCNKINIKPNIFQRLSTEC